MKNQLAFFILILLFQLKNIEAAAQACDSVVTNYDQVRYDSTSLWQNNFVTIDSFSNHLLRSSSRGIPNFSFPHALQIYSYTTYAYDVSNRLTESLQYYLNAQSVLAIGVKIDYAYDLNSRLLSKGKFNWNGTHWIMFPNDYTEYYYTSTGKDSLQITGTDTTSFIQTLRTNYTYNVSDSLIRKDIYQNTGSGWIPYSFTIRYYTPYGINYIRTDSIYYTTGSASLYEVDWFVISPAGDIIHTDNITFGDTYGYVTDYSYTCNHQVASYSGTAHGGSISEYSAANEHLYYDSLCRVQFYTDYYDSYNYGPTYHQGYYYHTDCSHMVVSGLDTIRGCVGDTIRANIFYEGGKSPYQFSWSLTAGLTSSTTLNPGIIVNPIFLVAPRL